MALNTDDIFKKYNIPKPESQPESAPAAKAALNTDDIFKKYNIAKPEPEEFPPYTPGDNDTTVGGIAKDLGKGLLKRAGGYLAGARFPFSDQVNGMMEAGNSLESSLAHHPIDTLSNPLHALIGASKAYTQERDNAKQTWDRLAHDSPISSMIGHGVRGVGEGALGGEVAEALPIIGGLSKTIEAAKSPIVKGALKYVVDPAIRMARGAGINVGVGQLDNGYDPSRIVNDAKWGAGGEALGSAMNSLGETLSPAMRRLGAFLNESSLKRTPKTIASEAARGETLGQQMYDRNMWGRESSLNKSADAALDMDNPNSLEAKLQANIDRIPGLTDREKLVIPLNQLEDKMAGSAGNLPDAEKVRKLVNVMQDDPVYSSVTAKRANEIKRTIDPRYDMQKSSFENNLKKAERSGYQKEIERMGEEAGIPEINDINKEMGVNIRLKDALDAKAAKAPSYMGRVANMVGGGAVAGIGHMLGIPGLTEAGALYPLAREIGRTTLVKTGASRAIKGLNDLMQAPGVGNVIANAKTGTDNARYDMHHIQDEHPQPNWQDNPMPDFYHQHDQKVVDNATPQELKFIDQGAADRWDKMNPESQQILLKAIKSSGVNPTINSTYRDAKRNAAVGGVPNSKHMTGDAMDLNIHDLSMQERSKLIKALNKAGGRAFLDDGNHIHFERD